MKSIFLSAFLIFATIQLTGCNDIYYKIKDEPAPLLNQSNDESNTETLDETQDISDDDDKEDSAPLVVDLLAPEAGVSVWRRGIHSFTQDWEKRGLFSAQSVQAQPIDLEDLELDIGLPIPAEVAFYDNGTGRMIEQGSNQLIPFTYSTTIEFKTSLARYCYGNRIEDRASIEESPEVVGYNMTVTVAGKVEIDLWFVDIEGECTTYLEPEFDEFEGIGQLRQAIAINNDDEIIEEEEIEEEEMKEQMVTEKISCFSVTEFTEESTSCVPQPDTCSTPPPVCTTGPLECADTNVCESTLQGEVNPLCGSPVDPDCNPNATVTTCYVENVCVPGPETCEEQAEVCQPNPDLCRTSYPEPIISIFFEKEENGCGSEFIKEISVD